MKDCRASFVTRSADDTRRLGKLVGEKLSGGEIVLLEGHLGAGKTVFVQGLAQGLGITGLVQSPSFVLERIHRGRLILRHLDLYRLTFQEAEAAGLLLGPEEDTVMAVEWAERVSGYFVPTIVASIKFSAADTEERLITLSTPHSQWQGKVQDVVDGFGS